MNIYNFTRWEYRAIRDHDSQEWTYINRVWSRFGAEVPLASGDNAWKPETWYVQLTRKNEDSPLKYTDNIFRLNIKIGMNEGIIGRLSNPDAADD